MEMAGIKPTLHRIAVYETISNTYSHPTADELFEMIKINFPTISLATIYNSLEILENKNLIKSIKHNNEATRYDLISIPHFHIYCRDTNEIIDYEDEELQKILNDYISKKFQNKLDYEIKDINLEIIAEKGINKN